MADERNDRQSGPLERGSAVRRRGFIGAATAAMMAPQVVASGQGQPTQPARSTAERAGAKAAATPPAMEKNPNPIPKPRMERYDPTYAPAYVANGFVALHIGANPLVGGSAGVSGYYGTDDREGVESFAVAPYPLAVEILIGRTPTGLLSQNPDKVILREQWYDFTCGELHTRFDLPIAGTTAQVEVLTFCSRSMPTLVLQETRVKMDRATPLTITAVVATGSLKGRCIVRDPEGPKTAWRATETPFEPRVIDGCMRWESAGGRATCGVAYVTEFLGDDRAKFERDRWSRLSSLTTGYAVDAEPGRTYILRQIASLVPSIMHSEPERHATRLASIGRGKGFDRVREENRAAWAELWKGRIEILADDPKWQELADACFFYLHSSVHQSSLQSVGPFGLGRWKDHGFYWGHVFWDCETWTYPSLLLTAPDAARALLDYRADRLHAARNNAALSGYLGIQFPWESGMTGEDVTPAWAWTAATQHHVNLDVAFAFAQFVHATDDEVFIREKAWPVLHGVAEWIRSRVAKTSRGYEILFVTSMGEGQPFDNDAFTNMAATVILREAIGVAERVGIKAPKMWGEIAAGMWIPRTGGVVVPSGSEAGRSTSTGLDVLAGFFPFTYRGPEGVAAATFKAFLDDPPEDLHGPMLASVPSVIAARAGDRKAAAHFFDVGVDDMVHKPFLVVDEGGRSPGEPVRYFDRGPFLANTGGFLMACLYGLTGLQLGPGPVESWCRFPVTLPAGWDAIQVNRIWVHGRPARLVARQGDKRAAIGFLD